jgi:hypothetical protein
MKWTLPPDVACTLEAEGARVSLGRADLEALAARLGDTHARLSPEVERDLFTRGLLVPEVFADGGRARLQDLVAASALAPDTQVSVAFSVGDIRLGRIEPSLGLGLAPGFVSLVNRLSSEVRDSVDTILRQASLRGQLLPPSFWTRELERLVTHILAANPDEARYVDVRGPEGERLLQPTDAAFAGRGPVSCRVAVARGGRGFELSAPADELPAVGSVLRALSGAPPNADLRSFAARELVAELERLGALAPRTSVDVHPRGPADRMTVTHLGHATLLVDADAARILIDPVLHPHDPRYPVQPLTAAELGPLDGVFFTHHHTDHIDGGTLLTLGADTPIFVPRRSERRTDPDLAGWLRTMGFTRVREIAPGESAAFGGLEVKALPFYGEGSDWLRFSGVTFVLRHRDRAALVLADTCPDSHGASILTDGALDDVTADLIFGTWWQELTYVGLLSPLAPFQHPVSSWMKVAESCDIPPDVVATIARKVGATRFVAYAERGEEGFLPPHLQSPYVEMLATTWRPLSDYAAALSGVGARFELASPLRSWVA